MMNGESVQLLANVTSTETTIKHSTEQLLIIDEEKIDAIHVANTAKERPPSKTRAHNSRSNSRRTIKQRLHRAPSGETNRIARNHAKTSFAVAHNRQTEVALSLS